METQFNHRQHRFRIAWKQVDDMSKKPIKHFLPGTKTFTIACFGCDFRCSWCCNFDISQPGDNEFKRSFDEPEFLSSSQVCDLAQKYGCQSISFSFTEPTLWYEYALYIAEEAHRRGLKTVWKSNGYRTAKILPKMAGLIDAANIDLKYFSDEDYGKFCGNGAKLQPVLDTIRGMHELGIHVEVSTILMPTMDVEELNGISSWISSLDPEIPWHINRFHSMFGAKDWDDRPQFSSEDVISIGHANGLKRVYAFEDRHWDRER